MVSAWVPIIAPGRITTAVAEESGDDIGQHEYSEDHFKGEAVGDAELLCSKGENIGRIKYGVKDISRHPGRYPTPDTAPPRHQFPQLETRASSVG